MWLQRVWHGWATFTFTFSLWFFPYSYFSSFFPPFFPPSFFSLLVMIFRIELNTRYNNGTHTLILSLIEKVLNLHHLWVTFVRVRIFLSMASFPKVCSFQNHNLVLNFPIFLRGLYNCFYIRFSNIWLLFKFFHKSYLVINNPELLLLTHKAGCYYSITSILLSKTSLKFPSELLETEIFTNYKYEIRGVSYM